MIQNIRVGIPIVSGKVWLGGVTYIELLVKAINSLPENERPKIFLVVEEDWLHAVELHRSLFSRIDGIIFRGYDTKQAEPAISQPFFHCQTNRELFELIDFYYPVKSDVFPGFCSGSWIPDFQHVHLPKFFTADDIKGRDIEMRKIAEDASLVVFSSKDVEKDFRTLFPQSPAVTRILSFHTLISDDWYDGNPVKTSKKYNLPERFLICCNQFWSHKNHLLLFDALAKINQGGDELNLVCTGSTSDYRSEEYFSKVLESIAHLGLKDRVHILGFIPRVDQIQLMRRALAVVQPSLFEGWSTVVEDSRALGKSVILSDLSVHYEQALRDAVYFRRSDAEDLTRVIQSILPSLAAGPDLSRERQARLESQSLLIDFSRQFCNIVIEAQVIYNQRISGISKRDWQLLLNDYSNGMEYVVDRVSSMSSVIPADTFELLLNADDLTIALQEQEDKLDADLLALVQANASVVRDDGDFDLAEGLEGLAAYIEMVIDSKSEAEGHEKISTAETQDVLPKPYDNRKVSEFTAGNGSIEGSDSEYLEDLQSNWNEFGEDDPMWSILTAAEKKGNKWEPGEFFETGINEIDGFLNQITSMGISIPRRRALDFGCGIGRLSQALAFHFEEVHGVDIAPSMIQEAKRYNRFGTRCQYLVNGRVNLQHFQDDYFDLIYTRIVLQHIEQRYSRIYLKEFLRVISREGLLVFQLPSKHRYGAGRTSNDGETSFTSNKSYIKGQPVMEMHGIEKNEVIKWIDAHGGTVVHIIEDESLGAEWESFIYYVRKRS